MLLSMSAGAQTFENKFTRPLSDVLNDVSARFGIRLKYNVDTTGLKLAYADFRVRPYSLEETLNNILSPFDFKAVKQNDKLYKIKPYEYPRRQPEDGQKMISWLTSLYSNKNRMGGTTRHAAQGSERAPRHRQAAAALLKGETRILEDKEV